MAKSFNDIPGPVQAIIIIGIVAAAAGGAFYAWVLPLSARIDSLKKEVQKLKAENDRNEAFKREQTEYVNRIQQLEKQLATLRSIVPDDPATDEFMKMIFSSAGSTGIGVRTFISQPAVPRELFVELPFTMRLDGTYYSMLTFFDRLSRQQRIVSISNLALGSPQGGGMGNYTVHSSETVGANCTVTTYYNQNPSSTTGQAKKP